MAGKSEPSFCWHCGGKLQRNAIGFYFRMVKDQLGYVHRVHGVCLKDAIGNGVKETTWSEYRET